MLGKESGEVDERTVEVWVGRLRRAMPVQGAPDAVWSARWDMCVAASISDDVSQVCRSARCAKCPRIPLSLTAG